MNNIPITFYISRSKPLTMKEKIVIAEQLAISLTLEALDVDTVTIDNDVFDIRTIRRQLRRFPQATTEGDPL